MTGMPGRWDELLSGRRLLIAVAACFLAYALFLTWPLGTNLSGQLSAPNLTEDGAGTTAYFAYYAAHHMSPFLAGHLSGLNAPYGLSTTWALNLAQAPSYLLFWVLVLVFGPVAGANVFMLLGFVMSGTLMFFIVHRLFGSRLVALMAGFAFAFYPFAVAAASVHYVFVHGWPLLLGVWRLIEMIHRPTGRSALLAGVATAFAMWWSPYYELLGGFALAICLISFIVIGYARGRPREAWQASAIALVPIAVLGVFFVALLKLSGGISSIGAVARPIVQVYAFSAHLRDYLPGPFNLFFGRLTGPYIEARLGISDTWDSAVYPGYVVVALAIGGLVVAVRALRANRAVIADRRVIAVLISLPLVVVAFVSSGPPTVSIAGLSIPLPSDALYHLTPTWQTFSRFIILLELALILMMAAALAHLRQTLDTRRAGLVFALIGLLLVFDLWARQPDRVTSTTPPPAYAWLDAHPGGTVADYPILPAYAPANATALFWAAYDGHPLLQGYPALSAVESIKLDLADLRNPQTASKLAYYGVRYIVVRHGTPGGSPAELRARGYAPVLINRVSGSVWRVTSRPPQTLVDARSGFDWNWGYPSYDRRLLVGHGALQLRARNCTTCTGTVTFLVAGFGRTRRLTVTNQRTGTLLGHFVIRGRREVSVTVRNVELLHGSAELGLRLGSGTRFAAFDQNSARLLLGGRQSR